MAAICDIAFTSISTMLSWFEPSYFSMRIHEYYLQSVSGHIALCMLLFISVYSDYAFEMLPSLLVVLIG